MSQLIPKSPLQTRAAFFLSKAYARINSGTSKKVNEISSAIRQLIDSIGWSALRVRPMLEKELPYADDYLDMIDETRTDLTTIHSSIPQLAQQGLSLANYGEAQKVALNEIINDTAAKVTLLTTKANKEIRGHFIGIGEESIDARRRAELFVENFENSKYIDIETSKNINYDNEETSITLQRATDVDHSKSIVPFIDIFEDNSLIGLPGNTVEVTTPSLISTGTDYTPDVTFVGETALNSNTDSLFDGNPDTVFEFERVALSSEIQPLVQIGDAYVYADSGKPQNIYKVISPDEWTITVSTLDDDGKQKTKSFKKTGIPASKDGKGLICDISLFFNESKPINLIEIDPYIPQSLKGLPITVESITVIPEIGKPLSLDVVRYTDYENTNINSTSNIINKACYLLPQTTIAREIKIILRQFEPYDTYAGHNFIVTTVSTNKQKSIFGFTYSNKTKITKPRLKTQDEQYNYNKTKNSNIAATAAVVGRFFGPGGAAIGWLIGSLFGSKTTQKVLSTEKGVDIFKAKRWQIGLRNISVKQIKYEKTGTFISKPITFENNIKNVSMKTIAKYDVNEGTLVTFDISPDNGKTWLPIDTTTKKLTPLGVQTKTVTVRANLMQSDFVKDSGLTPIIYGYSVEGYY